MESPLCDIRLAPCFMSIALAARETGEADPTLAWNIDLGSIIPDSYPLKGHSDAGDLIERARGRSRTRGHAL